MVIILQKFNTHKNKGLGLEEDLNLTNDYYAINNIALVYKKPTPIGINKISYPSRSEARIKDGFFLTPSTTDYNGVWNGLYLDFEAKETSSKTAFPLCNIHSHQIEHLKRVIDHKGISFLIVRFTALNKDFVYFSSSLLNFIKRETRKSIPLNEFEKNGFLIKPKFQPRIDYLPIIIDNYKDFMEVTYE